MSIIQQFKRSGELKLWHQYAQGTFRDFSGNGADGAAENGYLLLGDGGHGVDSNDQIRVSSTTVSQTFDFSWMDAGDMSAVIVERHYIPSTQLATNLTFLQVPTDKSAIALLWRGRTLADLINLFVTDGISSVNGVATLINEPTGLCVRGFSWDRDGDVTHYWNTRSVVSGSNYTGITSIGTPTDLYIAGRNASTEVLLGNCQQFLLFNHALTPAEFLELQAELRA